MNRFNLLSSLVDFEAGRGPFLSVYLDARPNENGKKDFDVFLKKQISEHLAAFEKDSDDFRSIQDDSERIREYTSTLESSVQGAAIFACSRVGFFQTFDFQVPFPSDLFFVFDSPHIYPLVRLISQNRRFAVALADTNSAHIHVFKRGERFLLQDIQNTKTNRTEVGGWSQKRYQRHIENFHQQHAKEVAGELEKLVRLDRIDKIILAGDETVIVPLLRQQLSKEVESHVAGVLPLNVNTPEDDVFEAAQCLIRQNDALEDIEKIKLLNEENYEGGRGVTKFENVLAALLNGQVQELYINGDFDTIDLDIGRVNRVLKDYAPGMDESLPRAEQTGLIVDRAIKFAIRSADDIRFIEDENILDGAGGIGALLRYQAKGVTNP